MLILIQFQVIKVPLKDGYRRDTTELHIDTGVTDVPVSVPAAPEPLLVLLADVSANHQHLRAVKH